VGVLKQNEDAH